MRASEAVIARPCPEDLDALGVDRSGRTFHCSRCDQQVHVLSNYPRAEAAALVPTLRKQRGCVLYLRSKFGEVVFREPTSPIPTRQLGVRRHLATGLDSPRELDAPAPAPAPAPGCRSR